MREIKIRIGPRLGLLGNMGETILKESLQVSYIGLIISLNLTYICRKNKNRSLFGS